MDMIKALFPYSFGAKDIKALAIKIAVYLVVGFVVVAALVVVGFSVVISVVD